MRGNHKQIKNFEYLDINGGVMYDSCLEETECEAVGWFQLSQDIVRSQAVVSTAMNLQIDQKLGNFLTR